MAERRDLGAMVYRLRQTPGLDSEARGKDKSSSSHDADGDWQTCGDPTAKMVG